MTFANYVSWSLRIAVVLKHHALHSITYGDPPYSSAVVLGNKIIVMRVSCKWWGVTDCCSSKSKGTFETGEELWGWMRQGTTLQFCGVHLSQHPQAMLPLTAAGETCSLGARGMIICTMITAVIPVFLSSRRGSGEVSTPLPLRAPLQVGQRTSSCSLLTWLLADKMRTSASSSLRPLTYY